jgi:hypothetical protein
VLASVAGYAALYGRVFDAALARRLTIEIIERDGTG